MSAEELIRACAGGGDEDVWREFIARFHTLIAGIAIRTARRWGEVPTCVVEDLVQETYLKLCTDRGRMFAEFKSRHPDAFYGYLKVVTVNVVNDYLRARHAKKRQVKHEISMEALTLEPADPGFGSAERIERGALIGEIDSVLSTITKGVVSDRDRTLFWLYWRQGLTAQSIAQLSWVQLNAKGVESVIYRLTRLLREQIAAKRNPLKSSLGQGGHS